MKSKILFLIASAIVIFVMGCQSGPAVPPDKGNVAPPPKAAPGG